MFLLALQAACTAVRTTNDPPGAMPNADQANLLATQAGSLLETDPAQAEQLLQQALTLDPYCGTAHNNLGTIALQGLPPRKGPDLYSAAESFQTASKLLPGRADPRMNLGLVMERAGRLQDALEAYRSAIEASPGHIPSMQALTSLEVRLDKTNDQTRAHLQTIALQGTDETWRNWAKNRLIRSGNP